MSFDPVTGRYNGPSLEAEVLEFWREHDVFAQSLKNRESGPRFSFNEGPPTANGKPGIHHVLARTFKDVFPRYKTMQGHYVPRKAGWDTHGLPVEHEVEKQLGIFDKAEIEAKVGIEEFTRRCRESVMTYVADWERMTERMGFWVNVDEAYVTLDNSYIESVWNLLQKIWDQGLIYRGYKVVPYDPRIGATLSSHELAQGYLEVEDPSIFVRFTLEETDNTHLLVWTTTPWTLPSNLALAVHRDVDYDYVQHGQETLIVASALRERVLGEREHTVLETVKGETLIGKRYRRIFDYLEVPDDCPAFHVWHADFVTVEDGTGIVHTAPAYGVDDLALGQTNGLPVLHGVGLDGHFKPEITPVAGMFFKDADPVLIKLLKERGTMFRSERYLHNYPFGWRTGDPIIYYAKNAWYIRTTDRSDRMVELNQTINWVPETIRDGRFGNWLENNVDWALSRERFWGTPLPVWTNGEGEFRCVGSVEELSMLAGRDLSEVDLHRPAVDEIEFEKDGHTWRRVPEVIDCWFDSGAMSYAQWHYPFENDDQFEAHFPADYICEAIDQTRGWFYTLHAIATLVSDSVAYRNVICLSHIVDAEGKKMSKSQGNILNPYEVFDTVGADALRWYFLARVAPDVQKRISVDIVAEVASSFVNTLWNTYAFFVMYARLDSVDFQARSQVSDRPEIDRWAIALLNNTIVEVTDAMEGFDAQRAGLAIERLVDQLSNWYVRRNRRRFWKSDDAIDKRFAYDTLYECLTGVVYLMAPFTPFLSETLYRNLVKTVHPDAPLSVHLANWPVADDTLIDRELLEAVEVIQRVVGLGRAARAQSGVRTRQPLSRLLVRTPSAASDAAVLTHTAQIEEELNVKLIEIIAQDADLVEYRIKPNLPVVGRKFGKRVPALRAALSEADGAKIAKSVARGDTFEVSVGDETLSLGAEDVLVETASAEGYACAEESGYLVGLDTALNDALIEEGLARELIRTVQEARKQADLDVSDRIILHIDGSEEIATVLRQHKDLVMSETLATRWASEQDSPFSAEGSLDGVHWRITLARLESA
ncbi:MAG: isoleucine--tRNA ligase [Pseudomonadota bacterium]